MKYRNNRNKALSSLLVALLVTSTLLYGCSSKDSNKVNVKDSSSQSASTSENTTKDEDSTTSGNSTQATDPTTAPVADNTKVFKDAIEAYSKLYKSNYNNEKYSGRIVLDAEGMPMMVVNNTDKSTLYNYIDNKATVIKELDSSDIYLFSDGIVGVSSSSNETTNAIQMYQVKGDKFEQFATFRSYTSVIDARTLSFTIDGKEYTIPCDNLTDAHKTNLEPLCKKLYGSDYTIINKTYGINDDTLINKEFFLNSPSLDAYLPNDIFVNYLTSLASKGSMSQDDFLIFDIEYSSQIRRNSEDDSYEGTPSWALMYRDPALLNKLSYKLYAPDEFSCIIDIAFETGRYDVLNYKFVSDLSSDYIDDRRVDFLDTTNMKVACTTLLLRKLENSTNPDDTLNKLLNMTIIKNCTGEELKDYLKPKRAFYFSYATNENMSAMPEIFDNDGIYTNREDLLKYKVIPYFDKKIDTTSYETVLRDYTEFIKTLDENAKQWCQEYLDNPDLDTIIKYCRFLDIDHSSISGLKYSFCSLGASADTHMLTYKDNETLITWCADRVRRIGGQATQLYICDNGRYAIEEYTSNNSGEIMTYYYIYFLDTTNSKLIGSYCVNASKTEYFISSDLNSNYIPCTKEDFEKGVAEATENGAWVKLQDYTNEWYDSIDEAFDAYMYSN